MAPKRFKLKAGKRAFEILATQAIGYDLLKGVIELVTNSDDSYTRLLARNDSRPHSRIEIEVDRRPRTKKTVVHPSKTGHLS